MKFDQLIEHNRRNIFFFKYHSENEAGRLVTGLSRALKKLYMRQKQIVCSLVSLYFDRPQLVIQ